MGGRGGASSLASTMGAKPRAAMHAVPWGWLPMAELYRALPDCGSAAKNCGHPFSQSTACITSSAGRLWAQPWPVGREMLLLSWAPPQALSPHAPQRLPAAEELLNPGREPQAAGL